MKNKQNSKYCYLQVCKHSTRVVASTKYPPQSWQVMWSFSCLTSIFLGSWSRWTSAILLTSLPATKHSLSKTLTWNNTKWWIYPSMQRNCVTDSKTQLCQTTSEAIIQVIDINILFEKVIDILSGTNITQTFCI